MSKLYVKTKLVTNGVIKDIAKATRDGMRKSRRPMGRAMENIAKERIREAGAIWKGELIEGFDVDVGYSGGNFYVTLRNYAEHAKPIEFGAEYEEGKGPPVAALIPWVQTKLHGYTVPDEDLPPPEDVPDIRDEATEEAINAHTARLASMADQTTIRQAFWLQQHIKETGVDAVRFMKAAEEWAKKTASRTVAQYIDLEMRKQL